MLFSCGRIKPSHLKNEISFLCRKNHHKKGMKENTSRLTQAVVILERISSIFIVSLVLVFQYNILFFIFVVNARNAYFMAKHAKNLYFCCDMIKNKSGKEKEVFYDLCGNCRNRKHIGEPYSGAYDLPGEM